MKFIKIILILTSISIFYPAKIFSQQRFPEDLGVQWIGDWPLGGAVYDVFVQDGRLFSSSRSGVIEWDTESERLTAVNSFPVRGNRWPVTYSSETYSYNEFIYPNTNYKFTLYEINDSISEPIFSFPNYATNVLHIPEYEELLVIGNSHVMNWEQWDISDPTDPVMINEIENIHDRFAYHNDSLFVLGSYRPDRIKLFERDDENIWNIISEINHDDPIGYFLHADTLLTISWPYHTHPVNLSNNIQLQRYLISDISNPVPLDPIVLEDLISPSDGDRLSQTQFLEVDDTHLIIATHEGYLSVIENHFSDDPVILDTLVIDRYGHDHDDEIRFQENPYYLQEPLRRISHIGNELFLPSGRGITTINISDLTDVYVDSSRSVELGGFIKSANAKGNMIVTTKEIYYRNDLHKRIEVFRWDGENWNSFYSEIYPNVILHDFSLIAANDQYLFYTDPYDTSILIVRDMLQQNDSFTISFPGITYVLVSDLFTTSNGDEFINLAIQDGEYEVLQNIYKIDFEQSDLQLIGGVESTGFMPSKYKFSNDFLFTLMDDTLRSYNLSDTLDFNNPLDEIEQSGSIKAINSNFAWIQVDYDTHAIISIADPYNLELINTFNTSSSKYTRSEVGEAGFFLSGHNNQNYFDEIYDITYPENPQHVGTIGKSSDDVIHAFSLGDTLWVLDSYTLTGYKMDYEVGVEESSIEKLPSEYILHPCCPNPFNPSTTITLEIPEIADLKLIVYNTLGQQIATLADRKLIAGSHKFVWNGKDASGQDVASGIYFVQMQSPESYASQKMLLLR